tara:strand:+ start:14318 stop:15106 length:789 start_codon:yes stop_codon:yes gene_type:complete
MDKKLFVDAVSKIRASAKKRKFTQSFDLIINLHGIDLKKENERLLLFVKMPFSRGKKVPITALVGTELSVKAKEVCDTVITKDEFKTADDKFVKKLANNTGFFIAQANVMPDVAKAFGRTLGTRGLMPNPKAGCVLPPTAEVKPVVENLQKTVRVETKNEKVIKVPIGSESMKDEEIVENAFAVFNAVLHTVPQEQNNIKSVLIKLSMGKPVLVGEKVVVRKEAKKKAPKKEVRASKKNVRLSKKAKKSAKKQAKKKAKSKK